MKNARVVLEDEQWKPSTGQFFVIIMVQVVMLTVGMVLGNLDAQRTIREEAIKLKLATWTTGSDSKPVFSWKVCQ